MSTSSIQDIDDATLGIVGNLNSTNGISSGGGSNFFTNLVNSGIASLSNSSPNSTSTLSDSSSSSPSSNIFTDLANSLTNLFSSSSSSSNSGERVTTGTNADGAPLISVTGKREDPDLFGDITNWLKENPLLAGALATIPFIASSIGGGGSTTNPPGDTSKQPGDTSNQPGDTSKQPGDTSNQPGDTKSPNPAEDELINAAKTAGISAATIDALLKYGLPALASYLSYKDAANAREEARGWSAPGGYAKQAVRSPGGGVTFKPAGKAAGGIASLASGGNVIGEKSAATPYQIYDKASDTYRYVDAAGYEKWLSGIPLTPINRVQGSPVYYGAPSKAEGDYGIGGGSLDYVPSMSEEPDETLSLPRYDMYGNQLEDDPNLKTMTEDETEEFEKHLALDPEFKATLLEPLRNAFMSTNAVGDLDVQQTLRNIYNNPETREIFYQYVDDLKYAPYAAAEWFEKKIELDKRSEGEGFTPDREYMPLKGTELAQINRENRYLPRDIANEMFRLVAPNTPDTVIKNYGDVKGNLPEDYVVTDRGQAIEPNQGLNVDDLYYGDLYYGAPLSEMGVTGGGGGKRGGVVHRPHYATGGMTTKQPFYLGGITDGMADEVPAHIDNKRPAALSDGEFVIPADVVSHLGNGNSNAGAKRLYEMMDRIREARTGNSKQGIQVNPNNFMPG